MKLEVAPVERLRITSMVQLASELIIQQQTLSWMLMAIYHLENLESDNTYIDQKQNGQINIINSGRQSNSGGVRINKTNSIGGDTTYFRDFEVYDGKDNLDF